MNLHDGEMQRRNHRHTRKLHETRLAPPPETPTRSEDPEVVPADKLVEVLRAWRRRALASALPEIDGVMPTSELLAERTGFSVDQIHKWMNSRQRYVALGVADRLLTAVEEQYKLMNGEIPILPNPAWTPERWHDYMAERGCV